MNRTPIAAATLCAVLAACTAPPPAERGPVRVDSPKEPEGSQLDEAMRALGSPLDNPITGTGAKPKVTGPAEVPSLEAMQALRPAVVAGEGAEGMRAQAVCQAGQIYGAAGGLAARSRQITEMLRRLEPALDQAFDFAPLVRQAGPRALMIPPVVTEQQMAFALGPNGQVARSTGRVYEIAQDARLAGGVPNWRTYLVPNVARPQPPPDDVRPKTDVEAKAWRGCVARGWADGEALAVTTYLTGLGEWQQLMVGAARGLVLAGRGLVRVARVAVKRTPVQGGGRTLRLDDAEMRLTRESALSRDFSRWRPTPEIAPGGPIGTLSGPAAVPVAGAPRR